MCSKKGVVNASKKITNRSEFVNFSEPAHKKGQAFRNLPVIKQGPRKKLLLPPATLFIGNSPISNKFTIVNNYNDELKSATQF
jgi:hypothetical protein